MNSLQLWGNSKQIPALWGCAIAEAWGARQERPAWWGHVGQPTVDMTHKAVHTTWFISCLECLLGQLASNALPYNIVPANSLAPLARGPSDSTVVSLSLHDSSVGFYSPLNESIFSVQCGEPELQTQLMSPARAAPNDARYARTSVTVVLLSQHLKTNALSL